MKLAVAAYYELKIDESVFVKIKLTQALNFPPATHNGPLITLNSSLLIKLQQYATTPQYPNIHLSCSCFGPRLQSYQKSFISAC